MAIDAVTAVNAIWGAGTADSLLEITSGGGDNSAVSAAKLSIGAMEREINRVRGYKLRLTPADQGRLDKLQEKIQVIDQRASEGDARADELEERAELFKEADRILGKPSANVEFDDTLDGIKTKIDTLLEPRLDTNQQRRRHTLETLRDNLRAQIDENPNSLTARKQLQNVSRQLNELLPARQLSELSVAERSEYDDLVEQANDHVGVKLLLNANESIKVFNLQNAINDLSASLPEDQAEQPSAAAVSRAYSRLF